MTHKIQINFGEGWKDTCYRPMDKWDADRIAKGLGNVYKEYAYRVLPVNNWFLFTNSTSLN